MEKLFGTDGVRGIPGQPPLTPALIHNIAFITAKLLLKGRTRRQNGTAPTVLMGRDTRDSGPAIGRSLSAGFRAAGCRTIDLKVVPTPALSYLTPRVGAICGVVISASHNPPQFNGIKFFTSDGYKMEPSLEETIENELSESCAESLKPAGLALQGGLKAENGSALVQGYVEFLRSAFPATLDLSGLRVVVDCAHGAATGIAPKLFGDLGAEVTAIGCSPDGRNINRACGALFPDAMRKMVVRHKADCGVSFDGDADRAVFADEKGVLLDGDALICLSALRLRRLGLLRADKVVLTVMSNFGLVRFLESQGVSVVLVPVGDRNVTQAIEKDFLSLGGESSGHIIFRRFAATGDGILTALQTLAALRESGKPLSVNRRSFRAVPYILVNLPVERKIPLEDLTRLKKLIASFEDELKGEGRIFVRYSGTEPLLRIMIEGPSGPRIKGMARDLKQAYKEETRSVL